MNQGFIRHHQKLVAQRADLLRNITQLVSEHPIQSASQLLALLHQQGIQTDLRTVSRELQGLQVQTTADGVFTIPDKRDIQLKQQHLKAVLDGADAGMFEGVQVAAIQTALGRENDVATALEACLQERILGTVPGRRVVLVIVNNDTIGQEALQEIRQLG